MSVRAGGGRRSLRLTIPGPPPRKNTKHEVFATRRKGGKVSIGRKSTDAYVDFCGRALEAWLSVGADEFCDAEVSVRIAAYWPTRRRADVDAPIECVLDALTKAGVWDDDSQVVEIHATKGYDKERPRVEVEIWRAE